MYSFIILMSTNGQQLNSEAIARYLTIIAANQRKLQYCREILSNNPAFIPLSYFKQAQTASKGPINLQSFRILLENLNETYEKEQVALIYSYFCIDEKSYVTFDQFYAAIIPKNNPSISKIIENRDKDSFTLDYSLKFALCKFYAQVYQTQYQLQMKRMFTINIDSSNFRAKDGMRISLDDLEQYLIDHSKFPTKPIIKLLHTQINTNKGRGKRNLSIRIYIKKYLEIKRLQKGQLPPIQISLAQQPQNQSVNSRQIKKPSNPSSHSLQKKIIKLPLQRPNTKENILTRQSKFAAPYQVSLLNVEQRIQNLLSVVSIQPNIPVIRWGNSSPQKPSKIPLPEKEKNIKNIQQKIQQPSPNKKNQDLGSVLISESLKYSSIKIDSISKKKQGFQEDQPGYGKCSTLRENSFSQRQKLRQKFKLAQQQPIYTPCRRLQDSSTPTVNKIVEQEKFFCEAKQDPVVETRQERTPQRKVFTYSQQKRHVGDSTSRYRKYSYLNDSRNSLFNRISYLKQLVSSPTKTQNYTSFK